MLIINMSEQWKKELKESVIDGGLMTVGLLSLAWAGSKVGVQRPNLSPSGENIAKLLVYAAAVDAGIAYAKQQKWIPT